MGDSEILAELEEIDCQTPQKKVSPEINKKKSQPRAQVIDDEKENRRMDMSDSEGEYIKETIIDKNLNF